MSNVISSIFSNAAKGIVSESMKGLDGLITSKEEKMQAKNELTRIVTSSLNSLHSAQSAVILSESKGNFLQRNWRPIIMLSFGFIIIYKYFISQVFGLPSVEFPEEFWGLLKIGMGGYVIGRTAEKVATTVTENVDMPFLSRRERREMRKNKR